MPDIFVCAACGHLNTGDEEVARTPILRAGAVRLGVGGWVLDGWRFDGLEHIGGWGMDELARIATDLGTLARSQQPS